MPESNFQAAVLRQGTQTEPGDRTDMTKGNPKLQKSRWLEFRYQAIRMEEAAQKDSSRDLLKGLQLNTDRHVQKKLSKAKKEPLEK